MLVPAVFQSFYIRESRDIKSHVCGKPLTSDSSWEFLKVENKRIKNCPEQTGVNLLNIFKKDKPVSNTPANFLSCNFLFSPTRFVWLAHTSSGSFTIQLRVPVFISKTVLSLTQLTPTDLRKGAANLVVIRLGNRRKKVCKVWHVCYVLRPVGRWSKHPWSHNEW